LVALKNFPFLSSKKEALLDDLLRAKKTGATFLGERSVVVVVSRSNSDAQEERPRVVCCDDFDAFYWNAPNKLSFFFASKGRIFFVVQRKKKRKLSVAVWCLANYLFPRERKERRLKRGKGCKAPRSDAKVHN